MGLILRVVISLFIEEVLTFSKKCVIISIENKKGSVYMYFLQYELNGWTAFKRPKNWVKPKWAKGLVVNKQEMENLINE